MILFVDDHSISLLFKMEVYSLQKQLIKHIPLSCVSLFKKKGTITQFDHALGKMPDEKFC